MLKRLSMLFTSFGVAILLLTPLNISHAEEGQTEQTLAAKGEPPKIITPSLVRTTGDVKVSVTPSLIQANKDSGIVVSPLISDPGGWQSRGKYHGYAYTEYGALYYTPSGSTNWKSAGGNFKIEFTNVTNSFTVQLREYDGANNADEYVGNSVRVTGNGSITWSGISSYVDGSNNEAEFYIATYNASPYQASFYAEGFD